MVLFFIVSFFFFVFKNCYLVKICMLVMSLLFVDKKIYLKCYVIWCIFYFLFIYLLIILIYFKNKLNIYRLVVCEYLICF